MLNEIDRYLPEQPIQNELQEMVSRVTRVVQSRTGNRISNLRVNVYGDDVVISGIASTYYAKQLATHAALAEVGSCELTNSIEVC